MRRKLITQCPERRGNRLPQLCQLDTIESIVHDYVTKYQPNAQREMRWYALQTTLERAVEASAMSKLPSGKRHPHQHRIPAPVLEEARKMLLASDFRSCHSFHDLFDFVLREIGGIRGAGELFVYDVSHRLGAFLGLEPERVYLHAGTRVGAKALGLYRRQQYLEIDEMPESLQCLSPAEMEDCLCIYKRDLVNASSS